MGLPLPLIAALCVLLVAILGLVLVWVLWRRSRSAALGLVANAEKQARRVLARAEIDGERLRKDVEIVARERLLAARTEFERETRDQRLEMVGLETTLDEKGTEIDRRSSEVIERETAMAKLEDELREQETTLGARSVELESALAEERVKLEQIAGLTTEQAKQELLKSLENEARMDAANLVRKIEELGVPAPVRYASVSPRGDRFLLGGRVHTDRSKSVVFDLECKPLFELDHLVTGLGSPAMFSGDGGTAGHMLLDLTPGDGKFEGKAVLTLHFGSLFLAGALS